MKGQVVPVFFGSSGKNRGVQPLLNAIMEFLPSPAEKKPIKANVVKDSSAVNQNIDERFLKMFEIQKAKKQYPNVDLRSESVCELGADSSGPLVVYAFKVVVDMQRGPLVWVRVHSGIITTFVNCSVLTPRSIQLSTK